MNAHGAQLNLSLAWLWVVLGFGSGFVMGLFFDREEWLGGYASFKRRLYRLGHISFFGLALINLMFYFTARALDFTGGAALVASWAFVVGAVSMPATCFLMANNKRWRTLFALPVGSLITGGLITLWRVVTL